MNENDKIQQNVIRTVSTLLIAFTVSYFIYSTLNTMNDPVFGIDFAPYHLAGRLLAQGNTDAIMNYSATGGFMADKGVFFDYFHKYFFPESAKVNRWVYFPAYLWLFYPFANLSFYSAVRIWLIFNSLICVAGILLLWDARRKLDIIKPFRLALYLFIGLTFQPVFMNLMHGQITGLMFFCFCFGYWFLRSEKPFIAGVVFGFVIPLKFYPALLLFYFILKRNWYVVFGILTSCFAVFITGVFTVGWTGIVSYFNLIVNKATMSGDAAFNNQSIEGFFLRAFNYGSINSWCSINTPYWFHVIRIVMVILILTAVIWAIRKPVKNSLSTTNSEDLDLSLVIMVMLLISPVVWYHYYMWVLFPMYVVIERFILMRELRCYKLIWLALAYAFLVMEGIAVIRPFASYVLQNNLELRIMLAQNLFGALLFTILLLKLRLSSVNN